MEEVMHNLHLQNARAHRYAVVTPKFVQAGRVSLTLITRPTLLVVVVKDVEVVVINVIACKDIRYEFHG